MTSGSVIALRRARARLVIKVRRKAVRAARPLHHALYGARSPSPTAAALGEAAAPSRTNRELRESQIVKRDARSP